MEAAIGTRPAPARVLRRALVDLDGRLLGLNTLRLEGGLILGVPASERLRRRAEQWPRRAPETPRLGVALAPPRVARRIRRAVGLPEPAGLLVRAWRTAPSSGSRNRARWPAGRGRERQLDSVDALRQLRASSGAEGGLG